ncbi:hypothetical protein HYDPIDRAFT_25194 [Hydnomerulius pinastri MD-312]|nr:hypothetical protein HYDPIDRAFT_25194 [Hydnomerulius pinastri MD-312]
MSGKTKRLSFAGRSDFDAESAKVELRPTKRRKVAGLNTRFDRMIETVNVTHSHGSSSPSTSRRRTRSSGTSSVSSYDIPKTPVGAYGRFGEGRLGKDSSVLRTNKSLTSRLTETQRSFLRQDSDEYTELAAAPAKTPKTALPDWLADTFCTLASEHPLRDLLSPSRSITDPRSDLTAVEPRHEETIFAFSPFERVGEVQNPLVGDPVHLALPITQEADAPLISDDPTLCDWESQVQDSGDPGLDFVPFSMPGCFAPKRLSTDFTHPAPSLQHQWDLALQQNASPTLTDLPMSVLPPPPQPPHIPFRQLKHQPSTHEFKDALSSEYHRGNAYISNIRSQESLDAEDNIKICTTPGPSFACSRPVYFDSPTEDPSFSDPLEPDAYELDLNAIDFRWQPFLRSNAREEDPSKQVDSTTRSQSFGFTVSEDENDQLEWEARITMDHADLNATASVGLPLFSSQDPQDEVYLEFSPDATQQTGVAPSTNAVLEPSGPNTQSPPATNETKEVETVFAPAPGIFISPLRDRPPSPQECTGDRTPRCDEELPLVGPEQARHTRDSE